MSKKEGEISRRQYLTAAGAGVVGLAAGAGLGYFVRPAPEAAMKPRGRYGMSLTFTIEGEPPELDPNLSSLSVVGWTCHNVYEGLLELDPDGSYIPCLANTWEIPDPRTYIFHLRDDVYFHDPDRKMIAEDVKYSFQRIMDPANASPYIDYTADWDRIECPDDTTVKIFLKKPLAPMLNILAPKGIGFVVVPKEIVEKRGNLQEYMSGTGPFKFVEFARGDRIKYERNKKWWKKDFVTDDPLPYVDGLTETFQADFEVNLTNLRTEQTHFLNVLFPQDYESVTKNPVLVAKSPRALVWQALHFQHNRKPWDDVRCRRAVAMCIDREQINQMAFFGTGAAAKQPFRIPPFDFDIEVPPYDPEGAKKLLADAGYPDGMDVTLMGCPSPNERKATEILAGQLARGGIRCKVDLPEIGRLLDLLFVKHDYTLALCGADGDIDPAGPGHVLGPGGLYAPQPSGVTEYDNPEVADLLGKQQAEVDVKKRVEIWKEIWRIALTEDVYAAFLVFEPMFYLWRSYVQLRTMPWAPDRRMNLSEAWVDQYVYEKTHGKE